MKRLIPLALVVLGSTSIAHAAPRDATTRLTTGLGAALAHDEVHVADAASLRRDVFSLAQRTGHTTTSRFLAHAVTAVSAQSAASPLALPNKVFSQGNGSQSHFGSGGGPFSNYHHSWSGFQDGVGANFNFQPIMTLFYAGTAFSTAASAATFMADSYRTTSGFSDVQPTDCGGSVGYPCKINAFITDNGDFALYEVAQVKNCTIETGYEGDSNQIDANSDDVSKLTADVFVLGVELAKGACTGGSQVVTAPAKTPARSAPKKSTTHPAATPKGFHGNCFAFRGALWTLNVKTSTLVNSWWTDLQAAYNNYPVPSGGSVPGPTEAQFTQAQTYMNGLHSQLDDTTDHVGLEYDVAAIGQQYGIKSITAPGPYAWAVNRVFGAMYSLDLAAYDEWKTTNSGLNDYHTSQQTLSNAWDALKQLTCH